MYKLYGTSSLSRMQATGKARIPGLNFMATPAQQREALDIARFKAAAEGIPMDADLVTEVFKEIRDRDTQENTQ